MAARGLDRLRGEACVVDLDEFDVGLSDHVRMDVQSTDSDLSHSSLERECDAIRHSPSAKEKAKSSKSSPIYFYSLACLNLSGPIGRTTST